MSNLGKKLQNARLEKGLSLDDVQQITKIQKRYLEGIENGNYKILPGSFYVRAFIRQFADAVDLNPSIIFEEFESELPGERIKEEQTEQLSRVSSHRDKMSQRYQRVYEVGPRVVIGVLILALFMSVWFIFQKFTSNDVKEKVISQSEAEYVKSKKVNPVDDEKKLEEQLSSEKETPDNNEETSVDNNEQEEKSIGAVKSLKVEGIRTSYELSNANAFVLEVISTGGSYLDIKNGKGQEFFKGMTKEGGNLKYDFSKEEEIILNIGRTLDVKVFINGQQLIYQQEPTNLVHQILTVKYLPPTT